MLIIAQRFSAPPASSHAGCLCVKGLFHPLPLTYKHEMLSNTRLEPSWRTGTNRTKNVLRRTFASSHSIRLQPPFQRFLLFPARHSQRVLRRIKILTPQLPRQRLLHIAVFCLIVANTHMPIGVKLIHFNENKEKRKIEKPTKREKNYICH